MPVMLGKVVVVNADGVSRGQWRGQLQLRGWQVSDAQDVRSAIDVAIREQPHAIITSVQLPDVAGFHFVRTLRGVLEHDITVIGIGAADPEASAAGFDQILEPPVDFDALHNSIVPPDDDPDARKPTTKMNVPEL